MTEQQAEQQPGPDQPEVAEVEAEEQTAPVDETKEQPEEVPEQDERMKALSREAKDYRLKMGEAKKRGDRMEAVAETFVRSAVEAMVADKISRPALVWTLGGLGGPLDLLGEEGTIDTDRLEAAVAATLEMVPEAAPALHHGDMGAKKSARTKQSRGFSDVLRGGGR